MDAMTALQLYRNKDIVEKAFLNIKDRLYLCRLLVSSEKKPRRKALRGIRCSNLPSLYQEAHA